MSKQNDISGKAWLVPAGVAGLIGAAVLSYGRSEEVHAAPGSPYYGKAVREAISGLVNTGANSTPAERPPLAAGLSPDEHYWCENCKTYHKREAGQGHPAAAVQAPAATPAQPADAVPPLPAGLSAADHYWCVNCKTYHARTPGQAVSGQTTPPVWQGVPYPLPVPPGP